MINMIVLIENSVIVNILEFAVIIIILICWICEEYSFWDTDYSLPYHIQH